MNLTHHTCHPRDQFDACDCPEPEAIMDTCEVCGLRLKPGELQFCNRHEPSRYECPVCHGKGYEAGCSHQEPGHGAGDCDCDTRCPECDGDGWTLLNLEDAERLDARSIKEPRR
jgi:hypothetical protein